MNSLIKGQNQITFRELYIQLSYLCNAECEHCYLSSSSLSDPTRLGVDVILDAIDQSREIRQISPRIAIGGGEPTLYWDDLLAIISHASKKSIQTILISNGWWGALKEEAHKRVLQLKENGLTHIEISASVYHRKYVPTFALNHIIELCKQYDIDISVHIRTSKSNTFSSSISPIEIDPEKVIDIPVMPIGRAAIKIDSSEFNYKKGLPQGNCSHDLSFLITPWGDCYPCCGGSELNSFLCIGNIKEEKLHDMIDRLNRRRILYILTQKGPASIIRGLNLEGLTHVKQDSHVEICDLCVGLFRSPEFSASLEMWVNSPNENITSPNTLMMENSFSIANETDNLLWKTMQRSLILILNKFSLSNLNPDIENNIHLSIKKQPSGAFLFPMRDHYIKFVPTSSLLTQRILDQANWIRYNWNYGLRCIPEILYTFSEAEGITGYIMPRYSCNPGKPESDTLSLKVDQMLLCLEKIWSIPRSYPQKIDWMGYVSKIEKILSAYDSETGEILRGLGIQIGKMIKYKNSCTVHGDPTFENVVYNMQGEMILLDPNPQAEPAVPIPELDFAKIMQSYFGWEAFIYGRSPGMNWNRDLYRVVTSRFGDRGWPLCTWLMISHLVRTLPYGSKINNAYKLLPTIKKFLHYLWDELHHLN